MRDAENWLLIRLPHVFSHSYSWPAFGQPDGGDDQPVRQGGIFHVRIQRVPIVRAIDDPELEIRLLRAQEISRYVEHGYLDAGITGRDWVAENESDVREVTELSFSKASARPTRWVLVVPEDSPIRSVRDLEGKRVATEAVGLTRRFFERAGVNVELEFSWGATEVKVPDLVDAIIDITETGSSLRDNKLRIVETLLESFPVLIANHRALRTIGSARKLETLTLLLKGALNARDLVGLKDEPSWNQT